MELFRLRSGEGTAPYMVLSNIVLQCPFRQINPNLKATESLHPDPPYYRNHFPTATPFSSWNPIRRIRYQTSSVFPSSGRIPS